MSEAKVKYIINGVEYEGTPLNAAVPGTGIQPQFTMVRGGGQMLYPGSGINPDIPVQPVEPQLTPLDAVDKLIALHNEHASLRKEFDALKARLKEKE